MPPKALLEAYCQFGNLATRLDKLSTTLALAGGPVSEIAVGSQRRRAVLAGMPWAAPTVASPTAKDLGELVRMADVLAFVEWSFRSGI